MTLDTEDSGICVVCADAVLGIGWPTVAAMKAGRCE